MEISRHLKLLAQKDPDLRRSALAQILWSEKLLYAVQEEEPSFKNPRGTRNYLINEDLKDPSLLFCAHYDAAPGSFGANDNAAAVCILIELAASLNGRGIPARFAFFDGEEDGFAGSRLYAQELCMDAVSGVINLDVCGYGDTIAVCGRGHEKKPSLQPFCNRELLRKHNGQLLKYLPKGDESSFGGRRIPALSVSIVPRWDIQYLKALATYEDSFLGRPPEFHMMAEEMEVSSTMHGGYRDTPDWVQPEAMRQVYEYLLEAARLPAGKKGFLSRRYF